MKFWNVVKHSWSLRFPERHSRQRAFGLLAITLIFGLSGCQTTQRIARPFCEDPDSHAIAFKLPSEVADKPYIVRGPERACVQAGDTIEFSLDGEESDSVVVVMFRGSPFANNAEIIPLKGGDTESFEARSRRGRYKYAVIDTSNGDRPAYDPFIIVR